MAMVQKQIPIGHGTGNRFARGLQKAEDFIEPLPEKPSEAQKKFYEDHVRRWNMPQEQVAKLDAGAPLAGSDYRTSILFHPDGKSNGAPVKLPEK